MAVSVSTTVSATIDAPRDAVFDRFIPVDLSVILTGYGPLPAVASTTDQTGPWDEPGSRRTVHLADGTTAKEEVTACEPPRYFAYRVRDFTNPLRRLTHEAEGRWWFEEAGDATEVRWTYTFTARSLLGRLLLLPIVKLLWTRYMRVGIEGVKRLSELKDGPSGARPPAHSKLR